MGLRIPIVSDVVDAAQDSPALGAALPFNIAANFGTSLLNAKLQGQTNDRNEANAWEMYRIAREDSNTAHQRETKDLEAAGLNPILSANKGASSASGSNPALTSPQITPPDLMPALQLRETMKNNEVQRQLTQAQTKSVQIDNKEKAVGGSLGADLDAGYKWLSTLIKETPSNAVKAIRKLQGNMR